MYCIKRSNLPSGEEKKRGKEKDFTPEAMELPVLAAV